MEHWVLGKRLPYSAVQRTVQCGTRTRKNANMARDTWMGHILRGIRKFVDSLKQIGYEFKVR